MSTTVTYKGQTLTTVENQTKTLNTAGTWVEGDFTLTDVTQGGGGLEHVSGTATITGTTTIIEHNANYNSYIWHAWIDDYATLEGSSNSAIEYIGFYNADLTKPTIITTIVEATQSPSIAIRYNPSTGVRGISSGTDSVQQAAAKSPTQCTISGGSGYAPHTAHMWHWECINIEDLTK